MSNKVLKTDVAIIGAGPAGLYSAYLLAKNTNLKISVFEEHKKIGLPVKCTGLVTNFIQKIIKIPKNIILNKIEFADIISPTNKTIRIRLKEPNLVLDRAKFDQFLAKKVKDSGVNIHLKHKLYSLETKQNKIMFLKNKKENIVCSSNYIIGADGPKSIVSRTINKNTKNKIIKNQFLAGIQIRIKITIKKKNTLEFYPIKEGFAWFVPESDNVARIGIASYKNQKHIFNDFLKRIQKKYKININKKTTIDYQAGLIPLYNSKIKTYKNINNFNNLNNSNNLNNFKLYIVGDSATQIKATTAGGIIQSLLAAKALAKSIKNKTDYEKLWKKSLKKDLTTHLFVRKILDRFSNKDYDYMFKLTSQKKIKKLLAEHDRDFILKLALKMIIKEPRYLWFLSKLI